MTPVEQDISLIIPIWNEEDTVHELHSRSSSTLKSITEKYEIIFVDDGSTDDSLQRLKKIQKEDKRVRIVTLTRNFGHNQAVSAGFHETRGRVIALIDGDLQNDPTDFVGFYKEINNGYEVIRGWRATRNEPLWRTIPSYFVNRLTSSLTGVTLKDYGCSMVMCRRHVVENLNKFSEHSRFTSALLSWVGGKTKEVEITQIPRPAGKSKYNFFSLTSLTLNMITGFTIAPLHIVTFIGAIMACAGTLGLLCSLYTFFLSESINFQTFLIAVNIFLMGIVCFSLGVMGEYIGRIYRDVQKRPYYLIKEIIED